MAMQRPRVGERAPDFVLTAPDGRTVRLADLAGKGPFVLYFYPRDETSICTVQACGFRDAYREFTTAGAEVVGVSRDDEASHARFAARHGLPFLLLSDHTGEVHARYGVRRRLGGLLKDRVTFVIDREGVVRWAFASHVHGGAHVREALAAIRSLAGER